MRSAARDNVGLYKALQLPYDRPMQRIDESRPFLPLNIAVLTVSDTRTLATDKSGDTLSGLLTASGHQLAERALLRDDAPAIREKVAAWLGQPPIDVVLTTGGTGFTGRDVTVEAVKPLFEKEYFVKATVIIGLDLVGTKSRGKVYLTGQVRAPGVLELMPGEPVTVSQAILRAQGLADFANKREVRLIRKKEGVPEPKSGWEKMPQRKKAGFFEKVGDIFRKKKPEPNDSTETIIVDLVDILEKGHLERDPVLKVGDLIVVPERLVNF